MEAVSFREETVQVMARAVTARAEAARVRARTRSCVHAVWVRAAARPVAVRVWAAAVRVRAQATGAWEVAAKAMPRGRRRRGRAVWRRRRG